MSTKKVLFVVAHQGFQPIEYNVSKKLLEEAGIIITTASDKPGDAVAHDGTTVPVEVVLQEITVGDYDGIVFIGGPNTLEHLDNQLSYTIIQEAVAAKKLLGAICVATRIVAKAGVLHKRQATGWDGDNQLSELYRDYTIYYAHQDVVVDDHIITATGPSAAREFAERIIAALQD